MQRRAAPGGEGGDRGLTTATAPAAEAGVAGGGHEVPHRSYLEDIFGLSFGHVQAHTGDAAAASCQQLGAEAYATGDHVAFASPSPSRELVAHELVHVVQQGGVPGAPQAKGDVGEPALEAEADRLAAAAAGGQSIAHEVASIQPAARGAVQRYGALEHKQAGDEGSGGASYDFKKKRYDFELTHGDIIMLSGDLFSPIDHQRGPDGEIDSLFELAARPSKWPGFQIDTQDEIVAAIKKENPDDPRFQPAVAGQAKDDPRGAWEWFVISPHVTERVEKRYLRLAQGNDNHFAAPVKGGEQELDEDDSAGGTYHDLHAKALWKAYNAGRKKTSIEPAMQREAAAQHYLTDLFSAGHLRTARTGIKDKWDGLYPRFGEVFKERVIHDVAKKLDAGAERWLVGPAVDLIDDAVFEWAARDAIEKKLSGKPLPNFSDVVARLVHDLDGDEGLWVVNDLGYTWQAFGDGGLAKGGGTAEGPKPTSAAAMVPFAVELGCEEIRLAYEYGASATMQKMKKKELIALILETPPPPATATKKFAALQVTPRLDPLAENGTINWKAKDFRRLWNKVLRTDEGRTFGEVLHYDLITNGALGGPIWDMVKSQDVSMGIPGAKVFPYEAARDAIVVPMGIMPDDIGKTYAYLKQITDDAG